MDTDTPNESGFRQTRSDYGPHAEQVYAFCAKLGSITPEQARAVDEWTRTARGFAATAVRGWAHDQTPSEFRNARFDAVADAVHEVWQVLGGRRNTYPTDVVESVAMTAGHAVVALVLRDMLDPGDYDLLTEPMRTLFGRLHPDDPEVTL